MKKIITLIFIISILVLSCSKDDFCYSKNATPKLNIGFYSAANNDSIKGIDSILYVWPNKKPIFENYKRNGITRITIPLNTSDSSTTYNIGIKHNNDTIKSKFIITYKSKEEYVSRSCGYRVTFENLTIKNNSTNKTWIKGFTPAELNNINNQDSIHVKIFH